MRNVSADTRNYPSWLHCSGSILQHDNLPRHAKEVPIDSRPQRLGPLKELGLLPNWLNLFQVYKSFLIAMFVLMVLGSTGRIGNVLVALRYWWEQYSPCLFSSSSLTAFLMVDFHTHGFHTYDCFLIGALTTSGTHREHLFKDGSFIRGLFFFFSSFLLNNFQKKTLPMSGFKLRISRVGSDR